jgi:hypothetical protein
VRHIHVTQNVTHYDPMRFEAIQNVVTQFAPTRLESSGGHTPVTTKSNINRKYHRIYQDRKDMPLSFEKNQLEYDNSHPKPFAWQEKQLHFTSLVW